MLQELRRLTTSRDGLLAVATLTLAYAAAVTAASVVYALRFSQIDVPAAERLVVITAHDGRQQSAAVYAPTLEAIRSTSRSITAASMYAVALVRVEGPNGAYDAAAEGVTGDYSQLAGVRVLSGRRLDERDTTAGADLTAVLGEAAAARLFGTADLALGRTIDIEGKDVAVVGIKADRGGTFDADVRPDLLLPTGQLRRLLGDPSPVVRAPYVVGRLASDQTLEAARAELLAQGQAWLDASAAALPAAQARALSEQTLHVESLSTGFSGLSRQYGDGASALLALAATLLALGIVNFAGFMALRNAKRHHELAVRLALGSSRWRLVATEVGTGVVLSLVALAAAIPLGWWAIGWLTTAVSFARGAPLARTLLPADPVLGVVAAVALAIGVAAGGAPAWRAARLCIDDVLRRRASTRQWRATRLVAVMQIAASLALVSTALLAVHAVDSLKEQAPALPGAVLWTRLVPSPGAPQPDDPTYLRRLTEQVGRDLNNEGAALSTLFPAFFGFVGQLPLERYSMGGSNTPTIDALTEAVSPGFFALLGIKQRTGRDFAWQDDLDRPAVAIVNEAMATTLGLGSGAVGRTLQVEPDGTKLEIVGVVADVAIGSARSPHGPVVFRPLLQVPARARTPLLHVSVRTDDAASRRRYVASVESLGRHFVRGLFSLDEWTRFALLRERLLAGLSGAAGVLAVCVTGLGLYLLMAQFVMARYRELGVRAAIGASPRHLAALVLRHASATIGLGIAIGVPLALALARTLGSQLVVTTPTRPVVFTAAIALAAAGAALVWLPTRRAADVDPARTLREE
jgi:predicted permease